MSLEDIECGVRDGGFKGMGIPCKSCGGYPCIVCGEPHVAESADSIMNTSRGDLCQGCATPEETDEYYYWMDIENGHMTAKEILEAYPHRKDQTRCYLEEGYYQKDMTEEDWQGAKGKPDAEKWTEAKKNARLEAMEARRAIRREEG